MAEGLLDAYTITPGEFDRFRKLIFDIAGISLSDAKQVLLVGRLSKRLKALELRSFSDYFRYVSDDSHKHERQMMVDLLTTNETYFFREPDHFDFLRRHVLSNRNGTLRIWSAASSTGEEAYSIAMTLADALGSSPWEIIGTDISQRVLAKAATGHYALTRTEGIPQHLLKKYCLRGIGPEHGTLLVSRSLRERVRFMSSNLLSPRRDLGMFDVIFLRNVMIYFEESTKRTVINNLLPYLKTNGHLVIGHSESLNGIDVALEMVQPTIYRRKGGYT